MNQPISSVFKELNALFVGESYQWLRRTGFGLLLLIIYYLAFTALDYQIQSTFNDKINHAVAFLCLAFGRHLSFPRSSRIAGMCFLLAYGFSIEIVQYFLPWREFSLLDVVADSIGFLIYADKRCQSCLFPGKPNRTRAYR